MRVISVCLLAFAAFLRFDKLHWIKACDLDFGNVLFILIEHSKTDIYRDGAWVVVARSGLDTYPVKMLCKIDNDSDEYIFCNHKEIWVPVCES